MSDKKTILVGIDGAPYSLLKNLSDKGTMPNLKSLRGKGIFKPMMASIPDNSAVSWSSIMTGTNPGEHGIFGFTDLIPNTYTMRFPNFLNMRAQPFWKQKSEKKYVIINLPFTYPAQKLNGYLVSGFLSPNLDKAAYPDSFLNILKEMDYRVDADTRKIYQSKKLFYQNLIQVHQIRSKLYRQIWQAQNWDTFMVVFTGTDRIGHYMIDDYENEASPLHKDFLEYYRMIDRELGWIAENKNENDLLIMMSDHGMEKIDVEVYLNKYLEENGYLKLSESKKKNYNNVTSESLAFVLEPARIYLNYKEKYPNGSVEQKDREKIINELTDLFQTMQYGGKQIVKDVIKKEAIYSGDQTGNAPDLVLISNTGFSLRGSLTSKQVLEKPDILQGMHRGEDAFFYINKQDSGIPENIQVEDIVDLMYRMEN